MAETAERTELMLPEEITLATQSDPRDLVVIGIPKIGKGTILGALTRERNALVLDLEKSGYEYIDARKLSTYTGQDTNAYEAFINYVKIRKLLLQNKEKYDYLIIDGLSDLDMLSEIGGTKAYMQTIIGARFNRDKAGNEYEWGHPDYRSVLTLPDGAGYAHTRKWFLDQIEAFRMISPYRIYAAHIADKYIKDNGKEEVVGSEIALTGKLKTIFASKVTALAKLTADGNKRYLNFDVLNDSILAGSRAPHLKGQILISEQDAEGGISTFWDSIYKG